MERTKHGIIHEGGGGGGEGDNDGDDDCVCLSKTRHPIRRMPAQDEVYCCELTEDTS
jgi:hypothetical protein